MQSFFPASKSSPAVSQVIADETGDVKVEKVAGIKGVDAQANFVGQKDRLAVALDATHSILEEVSQFGKSQWVVRYPTVSVTPEDPSEVLETVSARRGAMRRSLSFADDPLTEVPVEMGSRPGSLRRSMTMAPVQESMLEAEASPKKEDVEDGHLLPTELNVLRLDLSLGPQGSSTSASALVAQLEKASIANLLDERISAAKNHISKLRDRILDTSSKVLVTGDLNAGKSTFVNALLQRDVLPVDQQPCTTLFLEVHPASDNDGKEEVHVVNQGAVYSRSDESTFTRAEIAELEDITTASDPSRTLKLYINDPRSSSNSLLQNGVVDISLVDAPGLNRDSVQTTALFARQEEIDVVVFVVSAENHFTQSAKEFLFTASNEKAYIFIVVNKFDNIKDKARCKRMILEQVKSLSPRTWDDAENLVHFVDSSSALQKTTSPEAPRTSSVLPETFDNLEDSLRSFVLVKRAKSKLMPASTYLLKLLTDINLLASANAIVAQSEMEQGEADLKRIQPEFEKLGQKENAFVDELDKEEEEAATSVMDGAQATLDMALDRVGKGEIGVDREQLSKSSQPQNLPKLPTYPGLFGVWTYTSQVKEALLASLDLAVKIAQDEARVTTSASIENVAKIAEKHLPTDVGRPNRVFVPDAMFTRPGRSKRQSTVVAGGAYNLGIGLAQRPDLLEITFQDIFDVNHHISTYLGGSDDKEANDQSGQSALQVAGWALTGLAMVGGRTMGLRSFIEGVASIGEVLSNDKSKHWIAPVLGVCTLGIGAYIVIELPHSIPRTVGRQLRAKLINNAPAASSNMLLANPELTFTAFNVQQIGRETRKVVKLASFDYRERYRSAIEIRRKEMHIADEAVQRGKQATEHYTNIVQKTEEIRPLAELAL